MDINRNNYEQFFLDFIEGNLSKDEESELYVFLDEHPDLKAELDEYSDCQLIIEDLTFPFPETLKKSLPNKNSNLKNTSFDMMAVARIEGDLSTKQEADFDDYIQNNPGKEKEFKAFRKTFLAAPLVVFQNKRKLKKRVPIVVNWKLIAPVSAAAAIALMFIFGPEKVDQTNSFADHTEVVSERAEKEDVKPESVEEKMVEQNAVFSVKRNTKSPVPQSNYTKQNKEVKEELKLEKKTVQHAGLTKLDLRKIASNELKVKYDELIPESVVPPTISRSSLSVSQLAQLEYQRISNRLEEDDEFLLSLASEGLNEINKRTGSKMELMASKNEEGKLSGVRFNSRFLKISAPVRVNEE